MKILITEKQEQLLHKFMLKEAMGDNFSFEELKSIGSFRGRYNYCLKTLGPTQGRGSSRVIFQLSDNKVLKLALNNKGIAQNEAECDWGVQSYDVVPEIYNESDTNKYYFLVSEFVLPAKESDFEHIFNFDFTTFCQCLVAFWKCYNPNGRCYISPMDNQSLETLLNDSDDLNSFYSYMTDYRVPIGDMIRIQNYGMTNRSGQPQIVLLDSGLNDDVWNNHYKKY
jgi:hypothetical protein